MAQYMTARDRLPCRAAALEIASALAYLHDLNILHGDLAGGNILLTSSNKDQRRFTCKVRRCCRCRSPVCSRPWFVASCRRSGAWPGLQQCSARQVAGACVDASLAMEGCASLGSAVLTPFRD
jgi:serine/threonine protein kinase